MSLRGGTRAKKERRPYTRLEKGLLAFAAERESYASFYEYGATDEYEMFASMCRDVLMGVRGGGKAAPRCTALVEEAIQDGIPDDFTLGNAI